MSNTNTNIVQDKINSLVAERNELMKAIEEHSNMINQAQARVLEINGGIQTLVELFAKEDDADDTETETGSTPSSNEG